MLKKHTSLQISSKKFNPKVLLYRYIEMTETLPFFSSITCNERVHISSFDFQRNKRFKNKYNFFAAVLNWFKVIAKKLATKWNNYHSLSYLWTLITIIISNTVGIKTSNFVYHHVKGVHYLWLNLYSRWCVCLMTLIDLYTQM